MNTSNSECSSGCESGWTMYLDQLSNSTNHYNTNKVFDCQEKGQGRGTSYVYANDDDDDDNDDNENLSMVSDASSGPPQLHHYYENYDEQKNKNKMKQKARGGKSKGSCLYLDDTASSTPFFHFSKDNVGYSGFSQAQSEPDYKGDSKHLGFVKSKADGKKASGNSGSFLGRKRQ